MRALGMTVFFVSFVTLIQTSADQSPQGPVAGAALGVLAAAQMVSVVGGATQGEIEEI